MELKLLLERHVEQANSSLNRTNMELKHRTALSRGRLRHRLNRTNMELKLLLLGAALAGAARLNRTNMELNRSI